MSEEMVERLKSQVQGWKEIADEYLGRIVERARERDYWKERAEEFYVKAVELEQARLEITALNMELAETKAAMEKYVRHDKHCDSMQYDSAGERRLGLPCSCGLDQALKGTK